MAVRIEFFAVHGTTDFELVGDAALDQAVAAFETGGPAADGPARCVGWLSASDDDEARFGGWCDAVDEDLGIGLLQHGVGESSGLAPSALESVPSGGSGDGEPETSWTATLVDALGAVDGGRLGWRTHFDLAGTVGTDDDYPTTHHRMGHEPG